MVVTRSKQSDPSTRRQRQKGPKQRQITEKAAAKWKSLPGDLRNVAMIMFEDAIKRCKNTGDEDDQQFLSSLRDGFQEKLSTLKVPNKTLVAERDIQKHVNWLESESDRLQRLEIRLKEVLQSETSKLDKLQKKAEELRMAGDKYDDEDDENNNEIHPILKRVLDEN